MNAIKKVAYNFLFIYWGVIQYANAQTEQYTEMYCGYDSLHNRRIFCKQRKFPTDVYRVDLLNEGQLTMILRSKKNNDKYKNQGYLTALDIASGATVWEKKIHNFNISFTKHFIVYMNDDGNKIFERETGKFLYTDKDDIDYVDKDRDFVLKEGVREMDLASRESRWYRKIKSEIGYFEDVKWVSDSVFYIGSDGIHQLNLRDGKGWDFKINNSRSSNNTGAIMGAVTMGMVGGGAMGSYIYLANSPTQKYLSDNIILDSLTKDVIYIGADRRVKLDSNGNWIWQKRFKYGSGGDRFINHGDIVLRINDGRIYVKGNIMVGKPLFSAFSKETGDELYFKDLKRMKGYFMTSVVNDTILISAGDYLYKYEIPTGRLLAIKNGEDYNDLEEINPSEQFILNEGRLYSLSEQYPHSFFIKKMNTNEVVLLSSIFEQLRYWNPVDVWSLQGEIDNNVKVLKNEEEICLMRDRKIIAKIQLKGTVRMFKSKLMVFSDDVMNMLELKEILK